MTKPVYLDILRVNRFTSVRKDEKISHPQRGKQVCEEVHFRNFRTSAVIRPIRKRLCGSSGKSVCFVEKSITRNKKTKAINFVYLDLEIAGFGVHLIHPDVKMETRLLHGKQSEKIKKGEKSHV